MRSPTEILSPPISHLILLEYFNHKIPLILENLTGISEVTS